jgi:hypothetical protein
MRRLTERYRRWLRHRQSRANRPRRRHAIVQNLSTRGVWKAKASKARSLPKVLSFDENGPETVEVLDYIRHRVSMPISGNRHSSSPSKHRNAKPRWMGAWSDFSTLERITPAAALVMAADYARTFLFTGNSARVIDPHTWHPEVIETLWNIGFFDIVGLPQDLEKPDLAAPVAVLPMRRGDTADGAAVAQLIEDLRALYPGAIDDTSEHSMKQLYGAMVEGIVNVVAHAYPANARYPFRPTRQWFMTGAVDRTLGRTTAVIYDQGVTIPLTLPNWQHYAGLMRRVTARMGLAPPPSDPKSDGYAIAAAVEEAVSSTGDPHRGYGLAQMRDFVKHCREGHLRIMSRHGEVIFRGGGQPEIKTHTVSIGGTLLEWNALL